MKQAVLTLSLLLCVLSAGAHPIAFELDGMSHSAAFRDYLLQGFLHIIPLGLDHILFILCVFFLNTSLRKIILQASMFTIAHSITLGLAMYHIIEPPGWLIEPLIAASIVFLALENVFTDKVKSWRMVMVFLFGLIHGLGFAGALSELGMPRSAFVPALIGFNLGVELGQLLIILLMYFLVARRFAGRDWYRKSIVIPSSLLIAAVAGYWTVERIFFS